jgi:hypothetical protein
MIDLFISTCAEEPVRAGMAQATIARWLMEKDVRVHLLVFGDPQEAIRGYERLIIHRGELKTPGPYDNSERERRYIAETIAKSPIYILADDDILPLQRESATVGTQILEKHPDFGKICLFTIPDHPIKSEPGFGDRHIFEVHGCGGVRFIRKGIVERWAPIANEGYDAPHCREFHRCGFKTAYFKYLTGLHMGYGHTTGANPQ